VRAGRMEVVDMRGEFKYETKHNVIALQRLHAQDGLHRLLGPVPGLR